MSLTLASPVGAIDPRLAARRAGLKTKGPPAAEVLREGLEIETVRDLLHHYPRRYIDRSQVAAIRDLRVGQHATVIAKVKRVEKRQTRHRRSMVTVTVWDGTGALDMVFFNQPWTAGMYREGMELAVSATVGRYGRRLQAQNQEVEVLRGEGVDTVHTGRITPVHPATDGITTRTIRELVYRSLLDLPEIPDPVPSAIVEDEALPSFDAAVRAIHFPGSQEELEAARERLKFDELFTLELGVAFRKARVESETTGVEHDPAGRLVERLGEVLPYELTSAQRHAFDEIDVAMSRSRPMNVLLQGDVGAGKTVVALHAALVAIQSGHQAAVMAPTEVLAGQHVRSMEALLGPMGARAFLDGRPDRGAREQSSLFEPTDAADPGSRPSRTRC